MVRAFTAIDVPAELRMKVYDDCEELNRYGLVRRVGEESLHITLHFFENLGDKQLEKVIGVMDSLDEARFAVSLGGIDFFDRHRPKVIFVKVVEGADRIGRIRSGLSASFSNLGITTELGGFVPHLTVGRVKRYQKGLDEALEDFAAKHSGEIGIFNCDGIVLKRSDFTGKEVVHTELHRVELRG